ncbi:zinc finger protein 513-like isoform X1 [Ornithodoros turicata]|uniref:zinc finger protein 513-like isoform X1 n=1 Tax=Ornithodoros turicata TaxID=34597 RepID=UPI00313861FB
MKDIETTTLCFENEVGGYCPGLIFLLTTTMTSINIDCSLFPAGGALEVQGGFGASDPTPFAQEGPGYECTLCPYVTNCRRNLLRHAKTHLVNKPFKCTFCSYATAKRGHMMSHVRKHTGERPYGCRYCGYKASHPTTLTRHERIHTGEKPFKCSTCPYASSRKQQLQEHERTHWRVLSRPALWTKASVVA